MVTYPELLAKKAAPCITARIHPHGALHIATDRCCENCELRPAIETAVREAIHASAVAACGFENAHGADCCYGARDRIEALLTDEVQ